MDSPLEPGVRLINVGESPGAGCNAVVVGVDFVADRLSWGCFLLEKV